MASIRKGMIDNDHLFTAKYYKRGDKKISLTTDIPKKFKFSFKDDKGVKANDTFVLANRRNTATALMIETESKLPFKPDDKVIVEGDAYNITAVDVKRSPVYDLRALRGVNNKIKTLVLDR